MFTFIGLLVLVGCIKTSATLVDESSQTIQSGHYATYILQENGGALITVNVRVDSTDDSLEKKVDVFFMDDTSYTQYESYIQDTTYSTPMFHYYPEYSQLGVDSISYSFKIPETGTYYIVVDNAVDSIPEEAIPSGQITYSIKITKN